MAYTANDPISLVQSKINDTSFTSELVLYANKVNAQIHNRFRFRYMETEQSYTLTIGNDDLTAGVGLPTNLQTAISLRIVNPTTYGMVLTYIDYEDFDRATPVPSLAGNGVPSMWYQFGSTIRVYTQPDQAYGLKLKYLKKPTVITSVGDTPDVPQEWQHVLYLGILKEALEKKDRYDQSQIIEGEYQDALLEMANRLNQRQLDTAATMKSARVRTSWH